MSSEETTPEKPTPKARPPGHGQVPAHRVAQFQRFHERFLQMAGHWDAQVGHEDMRGPVGRRTRTSRRRSLPRPTGGEHAAERRPDGRQAGDGRGAGGPRAGVLPLVRGLPGIAARLRAAGGRPAPGGPGPGPVRGGASTSGAHGPARTGKTPAGSTAGCPTRRATCSTC